MKRTGLLGLVAACALASISCGNSSSKPLVADIRYRLTAAPGVAGCGEPNPSIDYVAQNGTASTDGGPPVNAHCSATKLADGTLLFSASSNTNDNGRINGISVSGIQVDPKSCDATTHVCTATNTGCTVRIFEDDGRTAEFDAPCDTTTPAPGNCQISQVTLDESNPAGRSFSVRVACNQVMGSGTTPPRVCNVVDSANIADPASLIFTACSY